MRTRKNHWKSFKFYEKQRKSGWLAPWLADGWTQKRLCLWKSYENLMKILWESLQHCRRWRPLVGWLAGWLAGVPWWLAGWPLAGWLAGRWLAGWLAGWLAWLGSSVWPFICVVYNIFNKSLHVICINSNTFKKGLHADLYRVRLLIRIHMFICVVLTRLTMMYMFSCIVLNTFTKDRQVYLYCFNIFNKDLHVYSCSVQYLSRWLMFMTLIKEHSKKTKNH